jgi:hypothetical protein
MRLRREYVSDSSHSTSKAPIRVQKETEMLAFLEGLPEGTLVGVALMAIAVIYILVLPLCRKKD